MSRGPRSLKAAAWISRSYSRSAGPSRRWRNSASAWSRALPDSGGGAVPAVEEQAARRHKPSGTRIPRFTASPSLTLSRLQTSDYGLQTDDLRTEVFSLPSEVCLFHESADQIVRLTLGHRDEADRDRCADQEQEEQDEPRRHAAGLS